MNLTLTLILSWFVVSIPFGILLGKALKVLARQESGECASLTAGGRSWMKGEERRDSDRELGEQVRTLNLPDEKLAQ